MKKKVFIILIASIFSIATINVLSEKNVDDICLNQIGVGAMCYGESIGSSGWSWVGGLTAGIGGGVSATGTAALLGLITVSNPVGWVVGGMIIGA